MNRRAFSGTEFLISLVIVVALTGTIFALTYSGIIPVKSQNEELTVPLSAFVPYYDQPVLEIKEIKTCTSVTEKYQCLGEKDTFNRGDYVTFRFRVKSSVLGEKVKLTEDYILYREGKIVARSDNLINFEQASKKAVETLDFKDYVFLENSFEPGEYWLEMSVENPLMMAKTSKTIKFKGE